MTGNLELEAFFLSIVRISYSTHNPSIIGKPIGS